jgi:DNA-binding response OmpR family regulator
MSNPVQTILCAGSNLRNLQILDGFLVRQGYRCVTACGMGEIEQAIGGPETYALALVDVTGFDAGIWDRCSELNRHNVPLLVISPRQSAQLQRESLTHGARGMVVKPLVMRELRDLVHAVLAA